MNYYTIILKTKGEKKQKHDNRLFNKKILKQKKKKLEKLVLTMVYTKEFDFLQKKIALSLEYNINSYKTIIA